MLKTTRNLAVAGLVALAAAGNALAERVQPFILASSGPGDLAGAVSATKSKLSGAGFEVVGTYAPYSGAEIIIFKNDPGSGGKKKIPSMNDKCAAGTGRFLEVMARALEVDLDGFGALSLKAQNPAAISSLCTVFAESEVISLIAKGTHRADIIAGIHESVAARVAAMANRVGVKAPVMMTGGVAHNIGVVKALEAKLGYPVQVSAYAQVNGAIGAACLAAASF